MFVYNHQHTPTLRFDEENGMESFQKNNPIFYFLTLAYEKLNTLSSMNRFFSVIGREWRSVNNQTMATQVIMMVGSIQCWC